MTRRSIAPRPDLMGETVAEAAEEEPAPGAAVVCPYRETVTAMNPAPRTEIVAQVSARTVPLSATAEAAEVAEACVKASAEAPHFQGIVTAMNPAPHWEIAVQASA